MKFAFVWGGSHAEGAASQPPVYMMMNLMSAKRALLLLAISSATALADVNNTVFVDAYFGDDMTGVRNDPSQPYQTIAAAVTAATSGDRIEIHPGNYTDGSLTSTKTLNLYFEMGASWSPPSGQPITNDSGGAMNVTIGGYGVFSTTSTDTGFFAVNSSSSLNVRGLACYTSVRTRAGTHWFDFDVIDGGFIPAVFWEGGTTYVHARLITSSSGDFSTIAGGGGSSSDVLYVEADVLQMANAFGGGPTIVANDGNMWIKTKYLDGSGPSGVVFTGSGSGAISIETLGMRGTITSGQALLDVTAQQFNGAVAISGGSCHLDILSIDDTGLASVDLLSVSGGTVTARIDKARRSTSGHVFAVSGGKLTLTGQYASSASGSDVGSFSGGSGDLLALNGLYLDSNLATGNNPLVLAASGGSKAILRNCVLHSNGSQYSITASSAQNVVVVPGCGANNGVNTGSVTVVGGPISVNSSF